MGTTEETKLSGELVNRKRGKKSSPAGSKQRERQREEKYRREIKKYGR